MSTVHRRDEGLLLVCKGSPEALLRTQVLDASDDAVAAAIARAEDLAGGGARVLAVTRRLLPPAQLTDPGRWNAS